MKKKIVFLISVLFISGLLSLNCFAFTSFTNTPLRGQETNYWCWCASDQMLLQTQGRNFTQTQIAGGIYRGATTQESHDRLAACASNLQWDIHYNALSFDQVKNTINLDWAIYCACFTTYGGHAMVITGYDQNPAGYNNVWLQDPWGTATNPHPGVEGWCNYVAPVLGNYANTVFVQWQNYVWRHTIC